MKKTNRPAENLTIGLLLEGVENEFQSAIYTSVKDALARRGVRMVCFTGFSLRDNNILRPRDELVLSMITPETVDGLIVPGYIGTFVTPEWFMAVLGRFAPLPVVTLGSVHDSIASVEIDNAGATRKLLTHLVKEHGCRRFGFIRGSAENAEVELRYQSFLAMAKRLKVAVDERWVLEGRFNISRVAALVRERLTARIELPDALLCVNDSAAGSALEVLKSFGYSAPHDVAVTGFDGNLSAHIGYPGLTTCDQNYDGIARGAVDTLLKRCNKRPFTMHRRLAPRLVFGESCGCFSMMPASGRPPTGGAATARAGSSTAEAVRKVSLILEGLFPKGKRAALRSAIAAFSENLLSDSRDIYAQSTLGLFDLLINRLGIGHDRFEALREALVRIETAASEKRFKNAGQQQFRNKMRICRDHAASVRSRTDVWHWFGKSEVIYKMSMLFSRIGRTRSLAELRDRLVREEVFQLPFSSFTLMQYADSSNHDRTAELAYSTHGDFIGRAAGSALPAGAAELVSRYLAAFPGEKAVIIDQIRGYEDFLGCQILCCTNDLLDLVTQSRNSFAQCLQAVGMAEVLGKQARELFEANSQLVKLRAEEQKYLTAIKHELDLARKIQADFLPCDLPKFPGWDIAVSFEPAEEVAGDFYDVFLLPEGRVGIVIADVSGKSVSAAIFMALTRSLLRVLSDQALDDPLQVVAPINDYIIKNHNRRDSMMFVTMLFGVLDTENGRFRYVNAGHLPPVVAGAKGVRVLSQKSGPAVGISAAARYTVQETVLEPGELFFAFTDGVTEAQDTKGVLLGKDRLYKVMDNNLVTPQTLIDAVHRAIVEHCGGAKRSDDITMVAMKRI